MSSIPPHVAARVSRETAERLQLFVTELLRWQKAVNLVATSTLAQAWTRHVDDSLQLAEIGVHAQSWLDLGSGAGLPGLVIAATAPNRSTTLIESDGKKCAFLRSTARRMGLASVDVLNSRIEDGASGGLRPTIVSARALAPLPQLLAYAQPFLAGGAIGLFLKGRGHANELTRARESWIFACDVLPSRTDPEGRILRIRDFAGQRT